MRPTALAQDEARRGGNNARCATRVMVGPPHPSQGCTRHFVNDEPAWSQLASRKFVSIKFETAYTGSAAVEESALPICACRETRMLLFHSQYVFMINGMSCPINTHTTIGAGTGLEWHRFHTGAGIGNSWDSIMPGLSKISHILFCFNRN